MTDQTSVLLIKIDGSAAQSEAAATKASLDGLTTSGNAASAAASGLSSELGGKTPAAARVARTEVSAATEAMGAFAGMTSRAKTELIVLAHELSQGQTRRFGGSLLVLAEQTGAASTIFSTMGLAVIGATAAIAGFAYEMYKGAEQSKEFNKALLLTGDAAGLTRGQYEAMIQSIGEGAGVGASKAREAMLTVTQSALFTGGAAREVSELIANVSKITGDSVQDVAKDLLKSGDDASKWVRSLADGFNYLTPLQYEYIQNLIKAGDAQGGMEEAARLLNKRLEEQGEKVGFLAKEWKKLGDGFDIVTGGIRAIADDTTIEEKLKRQQKFIDSLRGDPSGRSQRETLPGALTDYQKLLDQLGGEQQKATKDKQDAENGKASRAAMDDTDKLTASIDKQTARIERASRHLRQGRGRCQRISKGAGIGCCGNHQRSDRTPRPHQWH